MMQTQSHSAVAALGALSFGGGVATWVDKLDVIVRIGAGVLSGVASIVLVAYTLYQWRRGK